MSTLIIYFSNIVLFSIVHYVLFDDLRQYCKLRTIQWLHIWTISVNRYFKDRVIAVLPFLSCSQFETLTIYVSYLLR
jgi:hypothetical protein